MNISFTLDSTDIHEPENAVRAARIMQAIASGLTGSALVAEAAGITAKKTPAKAAPAKTPRKKAAPKAKPAKAKAAKAPKRAKKSTPKAKAAPKRKAVTVKVPVKDMGSKPKAKRTYRKRTTPTQYTPEWLAKRLAEDAGFEREDGAIVDPYGFGSFLADINSADIWGRARLACAFRTRSKSAVRRELKLCKEWDAPVKGNFADAVLAGADTVEARMPRVAEALGITRAALSA